METLHQNSFRRNRRNHALILSKTTMKKAILFLLLLASANSFAQIHRVAVYDFCTPSSLTPAITPGTENGDFVKTTNTVFRNGQTNISFKAGSQPIGSEYVTIIRNDQTSYYLRVTATTTMTFGCNEDSKLDSIRISDLSIIGDLHLAEGQPGYQDPYRSYKFWKVTKERAPQMLASSTVHKHHSYNRYMFTTLPLLKLWFHLLTFPLEVCLTALGVWC